VLNLLGTAAGWGLVSVCRGEPSGEGMPRSRAEKLTFPQGVVIRTLLKDLRPEELETVITLMHEHVPSDTLDDVVLEEISAAKSESIGCIVNPVAIAPVPNLDNLRTISMRTNMHIVACAGYFMQFDYPPDIAIKNEDQIADDLVQQVRTNRVGALGEIGQSSNKDALTPDERKVFRAVGKAHLRTNLPIFTHNPYGTGPNVPRDAGLRQLDVFESVGVKPEHIVIGHVCCLDEPQADIMKQIARRGAFVGFDRMGDVHPPLPPGATIGPQGRITHDVPDDQRVKEVLEFLEAGFVNQLVLADDSITLSLKVAREIGQIETDESEATKIKAMLYRTTGLGRAGTVFAAKLRTAGVKEDALHTILYDNPRRFLAFEPKDSAT
jgi:phosphotriesterase-related protein